MPHQQAGRSGQARSMLDDVWLDRLAPGSLFSLDGRAAVITGAAGGVGRWLAAGLGLAGARLLLTDRSTEELDHLVFELRGRRIDCLADGAGPAQTRVYDARQV